MRPRHASALPTRAWSRERSRGGRHPVQFGCLGLPRTQALAIRRLPTRILPSGPTRPATTLVARSPHFGHDDLSSSTRKLHDKRCASPTRERSTTARITDVPSLPCLTQDQPCNAPAPVTLCEIVMQIWFT